MLTSPCNSGSNPTLRGGYTEHFLRDRERENKPPWGGLPRGQLRLPGSPSHLTAPRRQGYPHSPFSNQSTEAQSDHRDLPKVT